MICILAVSYRMCQTPRRDQSYSYDELKSRFSMLLGLTILGNGKDGIGLLSNIDAG